MFPFAVRLQSMQFNIVATLDTITTTTLYKLIHFNIVDTLCAAPNVLKMFGAHISPSCIQQGHFTPITPSGSINTLVLAG